MLDSSKIQLFGKNAIVFILFITYIIFNSCNHPEKAKIVSQKNVINEVLDSIIVKEKTDSVIKLSPFEEYLKNKNFVDVKILDTTLKIDIRYSTVNNFLGVDLYGDFNKCYLNEEVANKLLVAHKFLKDTFPQYLFIIFDGVRPKEIQQVMWDLIKIPEKEKPKYLSNPKYGSLHNFGAAVDLSIIDGTGKELDMGTPYDSFDELAYPIMEKQMLKKGLLTEIQINNRKLLRRVMDSAGFFNIQTEWWHFNSCYRKVAAKKYTIVETFNVKPETIQIAENIEVQNEKIIENKVSFKVQVLATKIKMNVNDKQFKGIKIYEYFHKGLYKYTSGEFKTLAEAFAYRESILEIGIPEAFIVAFNNGERIGIKDAEELLNN